jgi:acylphosphatase
MHRINLKVHGKVQGVFFRASTVEFARSLGLKGYAKNLSDGSVEVVAEGKKEDIERLIEYCKNGPRNAIVERVDIKHETAKNEFKDFLIRQ